MATFPTFFEDARDDLNASAANKEKLALNHFNYFLKTYCLQNGVAVVEASSIPYGGLGTGRKPSKKVIFEFWDLMFGAFVTYIGNHAKHGCDPEGERLKRGTATQYSSAARGYFNNKFRNEDSIPVLRDEKVWNKLMTKLRGKYREQNRASGKTSRRR